MLKDALKDATIILYKEHRRWAENREREREGKMERIERERESEREKHPYKKERGVISALWIIFG